MGVSQSQTVLDLLPASGSAVPKRKQGSSNQAMFDVALKSASASVAQTSRKDSLPKQDVAATKAEVKGKAVPQNGKEVPEKVHQSQIDHSDSAAKPEKNKVESHVSNHDDSAVDASEDNHSTNSQRESEFAADQEKDSSGSEVSSAEDGPDTKANGADQSDSEGQSVSRVNQSDSEGHPVAGADQSDSEGHPVTGTDVTEVALSPLTEKELSALLADLKSGELTGEEFLAKLERVLESEGVSLDDLKKLMEDNDLLSGEKFDALLNDPEAFLALLQQVVQPESELSSQLKDLGVQADVIARLSVAINNRLQQDAAPRFADVLKAEANSSQQTGSLVSRLLQEQGSSKGAEAGFDKERLFEQLLAHKAADVSGKTSGFSGVLLKDGGGSNLLGAAGFGAASGNPVSGAEGLQGLAQRAALSTQPQNLPQLPVLRGLPGQPGATEALNERIMMMRSKGIQTAEIRLDPPDLGSLEVRVRVSGDATTIQFHSPNPNVREALEAQVNKLREMMEGAGVNLGQVDVSDQSLSDNSEAAFASSGGASDGKNSLEGEHSGSDDGVVTGGVTQSGIGLVDYFA